MTGSGGRSRRAFATSFRLLLGIFESGHHAGGFLFALCGVGHRIRYSGRLAALHLHGDYSVGCEHCDRDIGWLVLQRAHGLTVALHRQHRRISLIMK